MSRLLLTHKIPFDEQLKLNVTYTSRNFTKKGIRKVASLASNHLFPAKHVFQVLKATTIFTLILFLLPSLLVFGKENCLPGTYFWDGDKGLFEKPCFIIEFL